MNTIKWAAAPLLRLIIPFILGILMGVQFGSTYTLFVLPLLLVFVLLIFIGKVLPINLRFRFQKLDGLFIHLAFVVVGYGILVFKTDTNQVTYFENIFNKQQVVLKITEPPVERLNSYKVFATVKGVITNKKLISAQGKVLVYISKKDSFYTPAYGDVFIVDTIFSELSSPLNPEQFNYKAYLNEHHVFRSKYIKAIQEIRFVKNETEGLSGMAFHLRSKLLDLLRSCRMPTSDFAVASALMLGYDDALDQETLGAYSATGAMHVLSVSGLHLAVLFFLANLLLGFFDRFKNGKYIRLGLLLLFIWFYALLTGMSPSVLRSATMLSFVLVGKGLDRDVSVFNTLAASAFLLLLVDPYYLMDVGFQLSYLAVFGIVWLQPAIYDWFSFKNYLIDKVWALVAVSVAAQLATFPLALYYFHQFPNYFILANLIIIPLSSLLLYAGTFLFMLWAIAIPHAFFIPVFNFLVAALNKSVWVLSKLPYAVFAGVSITTFESVLLYISMFLVVLYFSYSNYKMLFSAFVVFTLFLVMQVYEQNQQYKQKQLIVYHVPHGLVFEYVSGISSTLVADSLLLNNRSSLKYHVYPNQYKLGVKEVNAIEIKNELEKHIYRFGKRSILILDSWVQQNRIAFDKFKFDLVIFAGGLKATEGLCTMFSANQYIISSAVSAKMASFLASEAQKSGLSIYNISVYGAFVQNL